MKDISKKQLGASVAEFLIQKSYPPESLHSNVSVRSPANKYAHIDLAIIDIYSKEYLAIFEFRTENKAQKLIAYQLHSYKEILNDPGIFLYYIDRENAESFAIYELYEGEQCEKIAQEKFPSYHELIRLSVENKKLKEAVFNGKMLLEMEKSQHKNKITAYFSIISIVIGVATAVLALFFQQGKIVPPEEISLNNERKIQELEEKTSRMELGITSLAEKEPTSVYIIGKDSVRIKISGMEQRIQTIEKGISQDPEKTLEILSIRRDMQLMQQGMEFEKEIMHQKINAINEKIETQNAWMLGILVAIFGTILAIAIPNILSHLSPQGHPGTPRR